MVKQRGKSSPRRPLSNQRRTRMSFAEVVSSANRRAHDQANRRSGRRELKSVRAAIAATDFDDVDLLEWPKRLMRWLAALLLLPLCWVTTWTFLSRFSHATMRQGFWQTAEFWYFAVGALMMVGWFASGLLQRFFLYLYVFGHELTHAAFVVIFRGKVTDFHVSSDGGYITTNKTNLLIALSPYFVPFWSVVVAGVYAVTRLAADPPQEVNLVFFSLMGMTWTFHMAWTLWMIPRDQPDLKENGTLLSLVVIYLANLLVLVALMCVAGESPWRATREFGLEWLRYAATWGDMAWHWAARAFAELRAYAKF